MKIEKLALGTVQFGLGYGISNTDGQISKKDISLILDYAKTVGIDLLDTASAYGKSESILGDYGVSRWKCITKLSAIPSNTTNVRKWTNIQIQNSLRKLKISTLHGVLLHDPHCLLSESGKKCLSELLKLRELGLIKNIGYSIYSPDCLDQLTEIFWPDIVQAPYNVFDQRIKRSGWLEKLSVGGVKVHARSVFLQGLLLMNKESRPSFFEKWSESLSSWDAILNRHEIRPTDAALSYVMSQDYFEKVIVGVNSVQELTQLIQADFNVIDELVELSSSEINLIEPFRWSLK